MSVLVAVVVLIVSSYHCVKMDEYQCIGKDTKTIVDRCKKCRSAERLSIPFFFFFFEYIYSFILNRF